MIRFLVVGIFNLVFVIGLGCGQSYNRKNYDPLANQQKLNELALFLHDNPQLEKSNLYEIKSSISTSPKAQQAQDLIEKVLDQFDFKAQQEVGFKLIGIGLNEKKSKIEKMEKYKHLYKDRDKESYEEELDNLKNMPTCEEFLNNPYTDIPESTYERIHQKNRSLIKKTLSGCQAIEVKKFLSCMEHFNAIISAANQNATCDIKNIHELENIIDKQMNGKYDESKEYFDRCLENDFKSCGFSPVSAK